MDIYLKNNMSLLPKVSSSLHILKADNSTKDKKQRKFYPEAEHVTKNTAANDTQHTFIEPVDEECLVVNRRFGDERRQSQSKRGRWLESREKQDRRAPTPFYLSI